MTEVKAEPLTDEDVRAFKKQINSPLLKRFLATIDALTESLSEERKKRERLEEALREIVALETRPFEGMPADWHQQIDACPECQGWAKNHPIQNGICDRHRSPLYARKKHEDDEVRALGGRARDIARAALSNPAITEEGK